MSAPWANTTIKFNPATSILKLQIGDEIRLTEPEFVRLLEAFFAEMERAFV